MNRNHLKIIACISMLLDHIGCFIFPQAAVLRWCGRLAMPLFAFFIGEGCRHTSNRKKYLLSVLLLGVVCQCFYIGENILSGGGISLYSSSMYFNILFTFSFAIIGAYGVIDAEKDFAEGNRRDAGFGVAASILYFVCIWGVSILLYYMRRFDGTELYFDYGICGVMLPVAAAAFGDRKKKLTAFFAALIVYCFVFTRQSPYVWFSLLTIPLLLAYNGKGGSKKLKYLFYVFYPVHFAVIYLISMVI